MNQWIITGKTGMVFVLLPGGRFFMGAENSGSRNSAPGNMDRYARKNEGPIHRVDLGPFFMSKYEMTQGQWSRNVRKWYSLHRMRKNKSYYPVAGSRLEDIKPVLPVEQIEWGEAHYVMIRLGLFLPTEAQWEYAARAGTRTIWWSGNHKKSLEKMENLSDLSHKADVRSGNVECENWWDGFAFTAPVGSFPPNPWGLHDMLGNVSEWCLDGFAHYTEHTMPGTGRRLAVDSPSVLFRGGSFRSTAWKARSACRSTDATTSPTIGIRPVRRIDRDEMAAGVTPVTLRKR